METKQLHDTLDHLIGHLVLDTPEAKKNFDRLTKSLSRSSLETDLQPSMKATFKFEKSDLFAKNKIKNNQRKAIVNIAKNRYKEKDKTHYKVFRREAPIREHLLHSSIADWAVGAKVDHSLGPFKNTDGRQFWYDFFPIQKLISLYMQAETNPVLLFNVKQTRRSNPTLDVPFRTDPSKTYTLDKGSIWILSKFLAPNAPAGKYTGLTISGGKLTLSIKPQLVNGKLTISGNTVIKVLLHLDQQEVEDSDETSPYGEDARKMQLQLPKKLEFHFSGNGRSIDAVESANWGLYGQKMAFKWNKAQQTVYDTQIQRIYFPFEASEQEMILHESSSAFNTLTDQAPIAKSGWVLPVATIDTSNPLAAAGIGEIFVQNKAGIAATWQGLEGGGLGLRAPGFLIGPGQIFLLDLIAGNPHASQSFDLWKDEVNPFGSKMELRFTDQTPFYYASNANGNELLMTFTNADLQIDRPVRVNGEPPAIRSLNSLLLMAVSKTSKLIYVLDDNLILDDAEISNEDPFIPERMAFAIKNALFKVTQPNGCLLFGSLSDDYNKIEIGFLFLTFGLFAYIPTLPDPYAANLGILRRQIRGREGNPTVGASAPPSQQFTAWLVCRIAWDTPTDETENNLVEVSFHFAPLNSPFAGISLENPEEAPQNSTTIGTGTVAGSGVHSVSRSSVPVPSLENEVTTNALRGASITNSTFDNRTAHSSHTASAAANPDLPPLPDYEAQWDKETFRYRRDLFALLDVSTNADLFGISFDLLTRRDFRVTTGVNTGGEATANFFPVQVDGMEVVSAGANVKAFTVPQISWEPVFNLTPQVPPPAGPIPGDPDFGFNYYPNDGGPSHILNNSMEQVALAPLPITEFLVKKRAEEDDFLAFSFFTLPFGLKAVASLEQQYGTGSEARDGGDINHEDIQFENDIKNGLQLRLDAGMPLREGDSKMFMGTTVQINNILNLFGGPTGNSTLGASVTEIFNGEFFNPQPGPFNLFKNRGVPMTRMDMSGYGANMFSNWLNSKAALAETSQAKFDIFMGRCAHEVIQVKSIVYPWAIKVVRTITLFRVASGYTYRFDSGWRAESDGKFDFRYFVFIPNPANPPVPPLVADERSTDYEIHPGLVKGLYNISNITETSEIAPFVDQLVIANGALYVDEDGREIQNNTGSNLTFDIKLQPLYFDADVELENTTTGFVSKKTADGEKEVVPSKRIVGFVQLAPKGIPLDNEALKRLLIRQGTIGGPLDCEVDLAKSTQKMRLSRFDFSNSFADNGIDPTFAIAGRGNVLLPKDGSWSMVKHERSTGDVSPVPTNLSIPVIQEGKIVKDVANDSVKVETPPGGALTRIAEPTELLRNPIDTTLNYGFLQSTDTQKALFLTPSFKKGDTKLLSKTPPLFVDAFRIVNSKGIFPNIGDATNFVGDTIGEAVLMKKNGGFPFDISNIQDLGQDVFELMDIQDTIDGAKQQGLQLLHNPEEVFDLPTEFELIDVGDGNFRIYIEYAKTDNDGNVEEAGSLDFDINSVAKSWKSKMNNIGLVIDLAGIKRLMTIRGNWDSKNGEEASYPEPELKFSPELQPLVDLLEILQSLQSGDYGAAIGKGLKLAMSNKAGSWEYKFEASKEIPVLRFPVPDAVYNDPNTPFKLECGLTIGAYFNAALKVTTDANELLPSAGGSLGFYARLSVMCVSISAATIYAIGQANVDIAADTKIGPSLRMKFGFGAQIVVGLPVAGNVSVLFVVGAEIFIASGIVEVSAFMLFEGHAEILGGIVAITIRIEAKGTYTKKAIGTGSRTDLECQVTFGLDISIAFIINISFSESWSEQRQIA